MQKTLVGGNYIRNIIRYLQSKKSIQPPSAEESKLMGEQLENARKSAPNNSSGRSAVQVKVLQVTTVTPPMLRSSH
jgi:hypothetical protein